MSQGTIEVMRDVKAMTANRKLVTQKVIRYTTNFGLFFGAYHGIRRALTLYTSQHPQANVISAALVTLAPLAVMPTLRPLFPYGLMLIALDAYNGIDS